MKPKNLSSCFACLMFLLGAIALSACLASAYQFFSYDIQENELVMFVLFLLLFFAIIYYVLSKKVFAQNRAVCAIVALLVSVVATFGLYQKGFFGITLATAAIAFGSLVILLFIFMAFLRASKSHAGIGGAFILFGVFLIFLKFLPKFSPDPSALPEWLLKFSEFSIILGIILCIIGIIVFIARKGR